MLCLTYIQFNILRLCALTDYHAAVYLLTGAHKERTSVLRGEESIGHSFPCFKSDQGTELTVEHITFVRSVAVEGCVHDPGAFCGGEEITAETDKPSGRNMVF